MQINENKPKRSIRDNKELMRKLTLLLLVIYAPAGIIMLFIYFPDYSKAKKLKLTAMSIIILIIFANVINLFTHDSQSTDSTNQQVAEQITFETTTKEATTSELTTKEITTEETTTEKLTTAETTTTQETTPAPTPTTEVVAAAPVDTAPAIAETPAPETQPVETQPIETPAPETQEQGVWVCGTGKKYHRTSSCSNMNSPYQISLSEAQAQGYEPCKKCY